MCGHHSAPRIDLGFEKMKLLTAEERGHQLAFYHIPRAPGGTAVPAPGGTAVPASGGTAVGNGAFVLASASAGFRVHAPTLDVVAAAPPDVKDIIKAPSACWSLGLLRRDTILRERSNLYTVGQGTNGLVYKVTFSGNGGASLCAKLIRHDDDNQRKTRIEVYALERCNESPSGIVRLLDVFVKSQSPVEQVYLVMEMWQMDLFAFAEKDTPTPIQIRSALHGPLRGLRFVHEHLLLAHCDFKSKIF